MDKLTSKHHTFAACIWPTHSRAEVREYVLLFIIMSIHHDGTMIRYHRPRDVMDGTRLGVRIESNPQLAPHDEIPNLACARMSSVSPLSRMSRVVSL